MQGVVIIYSEPPEARIPKTRWRLYPFKGDQQLRMLAGILFYVAIVDFITNVDVLYVHRQSAYLIGRDRKVCIY